MQKGGNMATLTGSAKELDKFFSKNSKDEEKGRRGVYMRDDFRALCGNDDAGAALSYFYNWSIHNMKNGTSKMIRQKMAELKERLWFLSKDRIRKARLLLEIQGYM